MEEIQIFFCKNNCRVISYDQVKSLKIQPNNNMMFIDADFTDIYKHFEFFDVVYSRFTLHSVSLEDCRKTLDWAFCALKTGGIITIEVRSVHDELYGEGDQVGPDEFVTTHYRRFVHMQDMIMDLEDIGFTIDFAKESRGWAKWNDEDPQVIRIVATK